MTFYVFIDVDETGLTLSSLNDTKSAFAAVQFSLEYFDNFQLDPAGNFNCLLNLKVGLFSSVIKMLCPIHYIKFHRISAWP